VADWSDIEEATLPRAILDGDQVGVHVADVVFTVPIIREKRNQATYLESARDLGHEVGVVAIRKVPKAVLVVERHVGRVLECTTTVGARRQRKQDATVCEHSVELVKQRHLVGNVLEEVTSSNDADRVIRQRDALCHISHDVDAWPLVLVNP